MKRKILIVIYSLIVLIIMAVIKTDILMDPLMTPVEYLQTKPFIEIGNIIIIVPSSTIIVYLLGIITILIGVKFFRYKEVFKQYWGISLILWGIGTVLAGTSYQGFGYELKCNVDEYCLFTSWFELSYLYMTALSITVMAKAVSTKSLQGRNLTLYNKVTSIGFILYSLSLLLGVVSNTTFLITYEWFLVFFLPYFVSFMLINLLSNRGNSNPVDKGLMNVWIIMLIVNILYFVYFYSGIAESLYENNNIWFSANDVLHIGLIPWMYYIYVVIKK